MKIVIVKYCVIVIVVVLENYYSLLKQFSNKNLIEISVMVLMKQLYHPHISNEDPTHL